MNIDSTKKHQNNLHRSLIRDRYISRITKEEKTADQNCKKMEKLEKLEQTALENLKNTTMKHEYVQNRFRYAFGPSLNHPSKLGTQSFRNFQELEEIQQEDEIETKDLNQSAEEESSLVNHSEAFMSRKRKKVNSNISTKKRGIDNKSKL